MVCGKWDVALALLDRKDEEAEGEKVLAAAVKRSQCEAQVSACRGRSGDDERLQQLWAFGA